MRKTRKTLWTRRIRRRISCFVTHTNHQYAVRPEMHVQDALRAMVDRNVRHLIISSDGAKVEGIASLRDVLEVMLEYMKKNLTQMESYLGR